MIPNILYILRVCVTMLGKLFTYATLLSWFSAFALFFKWGRMTITDSTNLTIPQKFIQQIQNILLAKLQSKYMPKLVCIDLSHMFTNFCSARQKLSKKCPSLTKLQPIFDNAEPSVFQKYSICWVFQAFLCSTFLHGFCNSICDKNKW